MNIFDATVRSLVPGSARAATTDAYLETAMKSSTLQRVQLSVHTGVPKPQPCLFARCCRCGLAIEFKRCSGHDGAEVGLTGRAARPN